MNSHIQLPKFIMKNFSRKTRDGFKVFYLDLKDNSIKEEKIKRIGTEKDYFSPNIEKFLSDNIESNIGEVCKKLKEFRKGKRKEISISYKEEESIKKFLKYSLIRSSRVIRTVNEASDISSLIGGYSANDMLSLVNFEKADNFFEDYRVDILENRTKVDFVISRNVFYSLMVKGKQTKYVFPITPKIAFVMINNEVYRNNKDDRSHQYLAISDNEKIKIMNLRANIEEQRYNNDFVIAYRKDELIPLQKYNVEKL